MVIFAHRSAVLRRVAWLISGVVKGRQASQDHLGASHYSVGGGRIGALCRI